MVRKGGRGKGIEGIFTERKKGYEKREREKEKIEQKRSVHEKLQNLWENYTHDIVRVEGKMSRIFRYFRYNHVQYVLFCTKTYSLNNLSNESLTSPQQDQRRSKVSDHWGRMYIEENLGTDPPIYYHKFICFCLCCLSSRLSVVYFNDWQSYRTLFNVSKVVQATGLKHAWVHI